MYPQLEILSIDIEFMHEEMVTKHQMQLNSGKHTSWQGTPIWKITLNAELSVGRLQIEDTMT